MNKDNEQTNQPEPTSHHPFCNYWMSGTAETCKQCKDLRSRFSDDNGITPDELVAKHFTDVQVIP